MKIVKATYLISSPSFDQCPNLKAPEYAFIGRSNVGKSSIINALCGQKNLAKTSGTPGKTQLINHFEITSNQLAKGKQAKWYIVDLPGYGFANVSQSSRRRWEQMIENYLRKKRYRVRREAGSISAEKGYLRESGNLLFHLSLVMILILS